MTLIKLTENERQVLSLFQDGEWWNSSEREIHYTKLHLKCRGLLQPLYTTKQLQAAVRQGLNFQQEYKITRRGAKALSQSTFVAWDANEKEAS